MAKIEKIEKSRLKGVIATTYPYAIILDDYEKLLKNGRVSNASLAQMRKAQDWIHQLGRTTELGVDPYRCTSNVVMFRERWLAEAFARRWAPKRYGFVEAPPLASNPVDDKIQRENDAKAIRFVQRLDRMMIGLRAPQDHPCRWDSKQAILYIARGLRIQKDMSGPVLVDEATIAWLEEAYARRPDAQDIVTRLRRKALGRPYEHACLLIEAAEEIERLRDER